jgi:hypothetical protein
MAAPISSSETFPEMEFLRELLPVEPVCMLVRELKTSGGAVGGTYIVCGAEDLPASTDGRFRVSTIARG